MGIIEDLYKGQIHPSARNFDENPDYGDLTKRFWEYEEILSNKLKGEDLELFNEMIELNEDIIWKEGFEKFEKGFKLGVQLMCDSLK